MILTNMGRYEYPIEIGPDYWADQLEDHQIGVVYVWPDGDAWNVSAAIRPGLGEQGEATFREAIDERIDQLLETNDPDYLGWFPSDVHPGRWHATIGVRYFPDV